VSILIRLLFLTIERKEDAEYFKLNSVYRQRFLSKMKISESDKVFIYDYSTGLAVSFPVKELNVAARLNPYGAKWPYSQSDYMIGFEIDTTFLKGSDKYFRNSLVYVGKKSPFVVGKVKPVTWKKIDAKNFPSRAISINDTNTSLLGESVTGNAYTFEANSLQYFVQEFVRGKEISARRLLVIKSKTKETVCEKIYFAGEGSSPAPLNFTGPNPENNQWTGKLFKNKPVVIFGFEYVSFGCPRITFLKQSENDIYINCDNRH
jgi:hypothetical protein